jgi:hypothetical protein
VLKANTWNEEKRYAGCWSRRVAAGTVRSSLRTYGEALMTSTSRCFGRRLRNTDTSQKTQSFFEENQNKSTQRSAEQQLGILLKDPFTNCIQISLKPYLPCFEATPTSCSSFLISFYHSQNFNFCFRLATLHRHKRLSFHAPPLRAL